MKDRRGGNETKKKTKIKLGNLNQNKTKSFIRYCKNSIFIWQTGYKMANVLKGRGNNRNVIRHYPPQNPNLTTLISVTDGFAKTENKWRSNERQSQNGRWRLSLFRSAFPRLIPPLFPTGRPFWMTDAIFKIRTLPPFWNRIHSPSLLRNNFSNDNIIVIWHLSLECHWNIWHLSLGCYWNDTRLTPRHLTFFLTCNFQMKP